MTIATKPQQTHLSLTAFLELPETKPASEYINGQIFEKPMPQGKHSTLQSEIVTLINQIAKSGQIAYAFPELRCNFAGRSLIPDIAVFEWANIPLDENGEPQDKITIAPDWLIEIISSDQSSIQVIEKIGFALENGTKLSWLIAPKERRILSFHKNGFHSHKKNDILPVLDVLKDWQISVQGIFALLSLKS